VLVHHAEQAVREVCTRALWLESGRVRMDGAVEEVLASYNKAD